MQNTEYFICGKNMLKLKYVRSLQRNVRKNLYQLGEEVSRLRRLKKHRINAAKIMLSLGLCTVFFCELLSGCSAKQELPEVTLSVWGSKVDQDVLRKMADGFVEKYKSEANITITVSVEGEDTSRDTIMSDPKAAADVYSIASDQYEELQRAGALLEITENTEKIISDCGGVDVASVQSAMTDGKLYAYPAVAGNGYFLYYNSAYFEPADVRSMDRLLEIAARNNKKISMEMTSGWYTYAFFEGAGLSVGVDEKRERNTCNWNATDTTYTGVQVAQAILNIAGHDGFMNCTNDDFAPKVESGEIIAGINGPWNAKALEEAWGENYAATKLPTYTLGEKQIQMHSFTGYRLLGVNAYTDQPKWSMRLAEWITNEQNQKLRYEERGDAPVNVNVEASAEVQGDAVLAAMSAQEQFAHIQNVLDTFWTPTHVFGTVMVANNPDGTDLQTLLDQMVRDITSSPDDASEEVTP